MPPPRYIYVKELHIASHHSATPLLFRTPHRFAFTLLLTTSPRHAFAIHYFATPLLGNTLLRLCFAWPHNAMPLLHSTIHRATKPDSAFAIPGDAPRSPCLAKPCHASPLRYKTPLLTARPCLCLTLPYRTPPSLCFALRGFALRCPYIATLCEAMPLRRIT